MLFKVTPSRELDLVDRLKILIGFNRIELA